MKTLTRNSDKLSLTLKSIFFLCGILIWAGCEPEPDPFTTFVIQEGKHYAVGRGSETLQSDKLVFDAVFNQSAIYDFGDPALQSNKNKLLGFSDCFSLHHENSARFAWQWFNDQLEIYAYCYVNGERREQFVGAISLDTPHHFEIHLEETQYVFYLENFPAVKIDRGQVCDMGVYYMLWPYFGGQIPAPHDVSIKIKRFY